MTTRKKNDGDGISPCCEKVKLPQNSFLLSIVYHNMFYLENVGISEGHVNV